jgi:ketosteroid isomerase-like protein
MSVEDKLAIHEAIASYSHTYDCKDAEAFAQLFVEDGIFEIVVRGQSNPTVRLGSRAAICEWAKHRHQANPTGQTRHYQSGVLFDALSSDMAILRTMLLLTMQDATAGAPSVYVTGTYHDRWRKTREGWRLVHRVARVDRDPGYAKCWA